MYSFSNITTKIQVSDYIRDYHDPDRFIKYCEECHQYGNCWSCPPFNFDVLEKITTYRYAYIIGTKIIIEEDLRLKAYDNDKLKTLSYKVLDSVRSKMDKQLLKLEKKYPENMAFFGGSCRFSRKQKCKRIDGIVCNRPYLVRHSLESFGFDISKTCTELLNIELKWSENGILPEYFILVSGIFSNNDNIELSGLSDC